MEVFAYRLVDSSNLLLRVLLTVFTDILENGFGKVDEIEEATILKRAKRMFSTASAPSGRQTYFSRAYSPLTCLLI
ncbi:hypothetical protein BV898_19416 [Hypsibius exemplaris]|uniref:Uncharacterized protein n=1 Tax=Hypsibius exemplaris TaxID=2072580 RepID=A0A9X6NQN7_HYPEX|nr:hypothetical protein BV898_19416 [Hypsibius exemplaris]